MSDLNSENRNEFNINGAGGEGGLVDLHIHTVESDGTDTPEEVLEKVCLAGITTFAICDHDTLASCIKMAELIGHKTGLPRFIRGVELSCEDEQGKYHILGYGYDLSRGNMARLVQRTHEMRMRKLESRLVKLKSEYGFTFSEEDVEWLRSQNNPGKPHIGNLMVKYGYAPTRSEAIEGYLNRFKEPEGHIRPEEAIEAILADGGIPVLAHAVYGDGDQLILGTELDERVQRMKDFGIKGLECYYSGYTPRLQQIMLDLAEKYDLYVTAGSDYHGTNKMIELGDLGMETGPIRDSRLEAFLSAVK